MVVLEFCFYPWTVRHAVGRLIVWQTQRAASMLALSREMVEPLKCKMSFELCEESENVPEIYTV